MKNGCVVRKRPALARSKANAGIKTNKRKLVPIFFAVDDNYVPCLAVAVRSLIDNASTEYDYKIHILIDNLSDENMKLILDLSEGYEYVNIEFVNVKEKLDSIGDMLYLRDYYTKATYYRFFIPDLFPEYKLGIYLDCDIVVLGDISELYRQRLGINLVGAAVEEVMERIDVFGEYVEKVLDVPRDEYFSAGILLMNLAEMRRFRIETRFVRLMNIKKFPVTQDQDYLNVLCNGRVSYFGKEWNRTPFPDVNEDETEKPKIAHYKINWKPWHYSGVKFENFFWEYADKTAFSGVLHEMLLSYPEKCKRRDSEQYENLVSLARAEIKEADTDFDDLHVRDLMLADEILNNGSINPASSIIARLEEIDSLASDANADEVFFTGKRKSKV